MLKKSALNGPLIALCVRKKVCGGINFCYCACPPTLTDMADAVQAQQRNLYQTKFAHLEYRDGLGNSYNEQLRQQSWPVVDDVPPQAQPSASAQVSVAVVVAVVVAVAVVVVGFKDEAPQLWPQ